LLTDLIRITLKIFKASLYGNNFLKYFKTTEEEEAMELVPHITLNPSFNIDMLEYLEAEEESPSDDLSVRVNSKSGQQNGAQIPLFGDRYIKIKKNCSHFKCI